ncbi:hypothetical protein [Belnapia rosea]|uniref:Uncharacterized protein n=1 Tax=Belnapia rosea TaxID=938405 RepID=A0A1G6JER7_9PROT|nr:hypothetical protein [Belnapia rosea]SDB11591.1 hypothetical protein SAMN02927895_00341 [Belnapia rosea]SDC17332.1 hypothetical protein SAMN04487779_1001154 [Belnapia rosea]
MKAFLAGVIAAAALAIAAATILDTEVQRSATEHFQTEGVRL